MLSELAGKGLSISKIAAAVGVSKATLDRRISEDEELKLVIEKGRANIIEQVASVALQMAISGKHPAMTQFWLRCNAGWTDRPETIQENQSITLNYKLTDRSS